MQAGSHRLTRLCNCFQKAAPLPTIDTGFNSGSCLSQVPLGFSPQISHFPAPPRFHLVPKVLSHFLRFYSDTSPSLPPASGSPGASGGILGDGTRGPHPFQSVTTQPPIRHLWNCRATPPNRVPSIPIPILYRRPSVGIERAPYPPEAMER